MWEYMYLGLDVTADSDHTSVLGHVESETDDSPHSQQPLLHQQPSLLHTYMYMYTCMQNRLVIHT